MKLPPRPSRRATKRTRHRRSRLRLEILEQRQLLTTFTVTDTTDAADADVGDGVCETSPGGPCTLRAAIQEANALPTSSDPVQIDLPAGTYTLSLQGIDESEAAAGDLDIKQNLILRGVGAEETIIDGGMIDRVIDVVIGTVEISGVTIRGGVLEVDEDPVEGGGGGIRNEGDLTITASTITGNVASFGAGIANYNGTINVSQSIISGNGNATTVRGGGIANYGNYDPAVLQVSDTTITGNRADSGGGISNFGIDSTVSVTIQRSTVSGNTAQDGGGVLNRSVVDYGGAVSATLTIRNTTISGNVATESGGGIRNEADVESSAVVDVSNSTIAANTATSGDGGGIFSAASSGQSTILRSVIVADNDSGGSGPDLSASVVDATFSLIESELGHPVSDGVNNNLVGQDPLLGPLADNGGPTRTHVLQNGSVAIDQGTNPRSLASDQRGSAFARTFDDPGIVDASDGTDIGAVEVGQTAATLDFGDAPEAMTVGGIVRNYPSRLISDGARHRVVAAGPHLGTITPDAEPDGIPTLTADGDDSLSVDDEDSLGSGTITLTPGQSLGDLQITHDGGSGGALLNVWIDLNLDGDWDDASEQVLNDIAVPAGASSTSLQGITLPSTTPSGTTFIRARISTSVGLTPRGEAMDGEVEDFAAVVGTPPPAVADLSLSQVVDDANPNIGDQVTFSITVTNSGPNAATGVEVTNDLPFDLSFVRSTVSQGSFDDLFGTWTVGNLDVGRSAVLTVTAQVEGSDPIMNVAEVTDSDQNDPDSTPGNGVDGEDDQATVTLGTCLTAVGSPQVGMNRLTYACASPGGLVAIVRGTERGTLEFSRYNTTVDISDAKEVAVALADSNGIAIGFVEITEAEMDQAFLYQAFEMTPNSRKGNTLSLQVGVPTVSAPPPVIASASVRNPLDVNSDSIVSALDALVIINQLSRESLASGEADSLRDRSHLDTNADSSVTALDALLVINYLSRVNTIESESVTVLTTLDDDEDLRWYDEWFGSL